MAKSSRWEFFARQSFASSRSYTHRPFCRSPYARSLRCEQLEDRRLLAVLTVTTDQDVIDFNDGATSLREAIFAANIVPGADEIVFDFDNAGPATILLTQGELAITEALTINGPGAELLTIDAQQQSRIFNITATTGDFAFAGMTITGGKTTGDNTGTTSQDSTFSGGAVRSLTSGDLYLDHFIIDGNSTTGYGARGGGVFARGYLTITQSTISANSTTGNGARGGGIWSYRGVTLTECTISENSTTGDFAHGGGILASGVTLVQSTVINNHTGGNGARGGGVFSLFGLVTLTHSTVNGNSTAGRDASGGGIWSNGIAIFTESTVNDNSTMGDGAQGGGIFAGGDGIFSRGHLTLTQSTVSGNSTAGTNASGGGIYAWNATLTQSTIGGNSTNGAGASGGGIFSRHDAFAISSQGDVTLSQSIVYGNSTAGYHARGGGIYGSNVTLTESTVSGNSTAGTIATGGGIYAREDVTLDHGTVSGNSTTGDRAGGGGILANGHVMLAQSTVSGNNTAGSFSFGGGIFTRGLVTLTQSTVSGNETISNNSPGGGIHSYGAVSLTESTLSGNNTLGSDASGGGVYARTDVFLTRSTLTDNRAQGLNSVGGGIWNGSGTFNVIGSILAGNTAAGGSPDFRSGGTLTANYSLIGTNAGTTLAEAPVGLPDANGNFIGGPVHGVISPLLGPLADNGGPTLTHALLPGSPAINAGDPAFGAVPEFDQRGAPFTRVFGGRIDIGAYETQSLVVDTLVDESDGDYSRGDLSFREAIQLANRTSFADVIRFDPVLTAGGSATILLTRGELMLTTSMTITGPGAELLTIDAQQNSRIFNITATTGNFLFTGMTLTGGKTTGDNANFQDTTHSGGAIRSLTNGNLTLDHVTVSGSSTAGVDASGGGIWSSANVILTESTVSGNSTAGDRALGSSLFLTGGGGIWSYRDVTLTQSTVSDNSTTGDGANGGGIFARGDVKLSQSTVSGNSTTGIGASGGGIFSSRAGFHYRGDVTLSQSTVSGNSTSGYHARGGGIYASNVTITESTVSGNTTAGIIATGGGIYTRRDVTLDHATVSGNSTAGDRAVGGAIFANGHVTLAESTITGNSTKGSYASGGAIYARSDVFLTRSTLTDNRSQGLHSVGGGIWSGNGTFNVVGSILAGNTATGGSPDFRSGGTLTASYSLIGTNTGTTLTEAPLGSPDANGNLIGGPIHGVINPLLGPLADNGGPTFTHALLPGSPAINAGDPAFGAVPEFDQRGAPFTRVFGGRIDIGAYETQSLVVDTLVDENDGDYSRGDFSLREALELANQIQSLNEIEFDPSLAGGTILLTMGELAITSSMEIIGLGAELLTIDASGNDPTPDVNNGDGSRVFNIDAGEADIEVALGGLRMTGGDTADRGGAINTTSSLTLEHCIVDDNYSATEGGGLYVALDGNEELRIESSLVEGNRANRYLGRGAGIALYPIENSTVTITDSIFRGNTFGTLGTNLNLGGGLYAYLDDQTVMDLFGCTFEENSGYIGGGLRTELWRDSHLTIRDCYLSNNSSVDAGAISLRARFNSNVLMENNTIIGNNAVNGGAGALIGTTENATLVMRSTSVSENIGGRGAGLVLAVTSSSEMRLENCTISGNVSRSESGGGIYGGLTYRGSLTIENCTISGNSAQKTGDGDFQRVLENATAVISSSTITQNTSEGDLGSFGGGVFITAGRLTLKHTIIANNHDLSGVAPDLGGIRPYQISKYNTILGDNRGSFLTEAPLGFPDANGNLIGGPIHGVINPLLGPLADNGGPTLTHALLPGSPAINAGDPTLAVGVAGTPEFDQRSAPFTRIAGGRIDIGAYESQPAAGTFDGDFDGDGDVDGRDFLTWQRGHGSLNATKPQGDATGDHDVDGNDLSVWQETYGREAELLAISSQLLARQESSDESREPDSSMAPWAVNVLCDTRAGGPCYDHASDVVSEVEDFEVAVDRALEELAVVPRNAVRGFGDIATRRAAVRESSIEIEWN